MVIVNQESDEDSRPEEHRDEGSLFMYQGGFLSRATKRSRGIPLACGEDVYLRRIPAATASAILLAPEESRA